MGFLHTFPNFGFRIDLNAGVTVKRGDWEIASVNITGTLTGTAPYHLVGDAVFYCIKKITFPIDETFGSDELSEIAPIKTLLDLWNDLKKELEQVQNWVAIPSSA